MHDLRFVARNAAARVVRPFRSAGEFWRRAVPAREVTGKCDNGGTVSYDAVNGVLIHLVAERQHPIYEDVMLKLTGHLVIATRNICRC